MASAERVNFKINDKEHSVGKEVTSDLTLVDYIRNECSLRGTKYLCREGGCGACIVSVVKSPDTLPVAVNSCLILVTSCQGWEITTIEKIGNRFDEYHDIQKAMAKHNGTQCGYCTPGWIMSMYSLLENKKNLTKLEIEKSFGSNICRCTGYRPILDAFKEFASEATDSIMDIEDLKICNKTGKKCEKNHCHDKCASKKDLHEEDDWYMINNVEAENIIIELKDGKYWFKVSTIANIFTVLANAGNPESYMLVAGNTAKGAYPIDEYPHYLIDICGIEELKGYLIDQNLVIGAGNTLTEVMEIFQSNVTTQYFGYLQKLWDHLEHVAHIPVRNMGTLAGNLMIKHQHNEFPSDPFLLLETIGAEMTIVSNSGLEDTVTMEAFLETDMKSKVIKNVILPPMSDEYRLVTFKIMPRSQSAHAIVNAGFLYKLNTDEITVSSSRIVYGGLSPTFFRAAATETYLQGKELFTNDTLQGALKILNDELVVTEMPPEPSVEYRKKLALSLLYKGLLILYPNTLGSTYQSGVTKLHESRPVSQSRQTYDSNSLLWPLNKAMPKVESMIQCAGEAQYSEDIPTTCRDVYAAFVLATIPCGDIDAIDPSKALEMPGVVAFYSAKDIPGDNAMTLPQSQFNQYHEEIICSGAVGYYNQPIGIIVAESRPLAERASKLVEVTYKNIRDPILDIHVAKDIPERTSPFMNFIATSIGLNGKHELEGSNNLYGQYHMCMETIVCVTVPVENGLEVYPATQWMDGTQSVIARALKMDSNKIDVYVRRLGGGFGVKILRTSQIAAACSLVAKILNRPCRFIQALTTNFRAVGKRYPASNQYKFTTDDSGEIQRMDYTLYENNGFTTDIGMSLLGLGSTTNCYRSARWNIEGFNVNTDMAKNTYCRAPGTLENISLAEFIMEHISYAQSLDPVDVRLANLNILLHSEVKTMWNTLKVDADYDKRKAEVVQFNKDNRWKKRGLRVAFDKWSPLGAQRLDVNLSVYNNDGTVVITHAGVEMGQGINTLAVQIAAYLLKIDVSKIQIKGNNSIIAPNSYLSGGSYTGTNVCIGVQRCCEILLAKLAPIRLTLLNPAWEVLITAAYSLDVDLQIHSSVGFLDIQLYNIYGVACAEVEIDVLTGELEILRVDILQDTGRSINPDIDIGQIEGAFIMGVGYWTCENLVYDSKTGEMLTDRTWSYYVPQARDIPQDFRVSLLKKSYSNEKMLGAKATGEPPICLSPVISMAIREAEVAARFDVGIPTTVFYPFNGPSTTERISLNCKTRIQDFKFVSNN